jgi:hypothetical protein
MDADERRWEWDTNFTNEHEWETIGGIRVHS